MEVGGRGTFDRARIDRDLADAFARLAARPGGEFGFNHGASYAEQRLNYPAEELSRLPSNVVRRFAGVGNPHRLGPVRPGETVLDHGCGAGTDLIIAARRTGPTGRVIGVDRTSGMLEHAWQGCVQAGVDGWATLFHGRCEDLPIDDASVDVAISNGALRFAEDKSRVLAELFRVLKPGGRLHLSDVVLQRPLGGPEQEPPLWLAGIAGATVESALREAVALAGFVKAQITERFDCYRHAPVEPQLPANVGPGAVNFFARKPAL